MIRRATIIDAKACHDVMWSAVTDFATRRGMPLRGTAAEWWERGELFLRFLAEIAAEWWLAEEDGEVIGFARSIERGGLFELTEFFVLPSRQSAGVGRALLERAFPSGRGDVRSIIATTDVRALTSYVRAGMIPHFPMLTLVGKPALAVLPEGWTSRSFDVESTADVDVVRAIERDVLEHPRGPRELQWLAQTREVHLYTRSARTIGFAAVGSGGAGPIAALDACDLPSMLLHVEGRAHALGIEELELQVPGLNVIAMKHLLERGFKIDPWVNLLMSDRAFGKFDRLLPFGPVFL